MRGTAASNVPASSRQQQLLLLLFLACRADSPCPHNVAITPRSAASCSDLSQRSFSNLLGSNDVCGASNFEDPHGVACAGPTEKCCHTTTFLAAHEICIHAGARLCSLEELQDNEAAGTGCGFDAKHVWTSTRGVCAEGAFMAAAGNVAHQNQVDNIPAECTSLGHHLAVRCCGDAVAADTEEDTCDSMASLLTCGELRTISGAEWADGATATFCHEQFATQNSCSSYCGGIAARQCRTLEMDAMGQEEQAGVCECCADMEITLAPCTRTSIVALSDGMSAITHVHEQWDLHCSWAFVGCDAGFGISLDFSQLETDAQALVHLYSVDYRPVEGEIFDPTSDDSKELLAELRGHDASPQIRRFRRDANHAMVGVPRNQRFEGLTGPVNTASHDVVLELRSTSAATVSFAVEPSCVLISPHGCTDSAASNYDASATVDDGSCAGALGTCTDSQSCGAGLTCTQVTGNEAECGCSVSSSVTAFGGLDTTVLASHRYLAAANTVGAVIADHISEPDLYSTELCAADSSSATFATAVSSAAAGDFLWFRFWEQTAEGSGLRVRAITVVVEGCVTASCDSAEDAVVEAGTPTPAYSERSAEWPEWRGGAFDCREGARCYLRRLTVRDALSKGNGGVAVALGGILFVQDAVFRDNVAISFHGAVWCHTNSYCDFERVGFIGNYAENNGALGTWSTVRIADSQFTGNYALRGSAVTANRIISARACTDAAIHCFPTETCGCEGEACYCEPSLFVERSLFAHNTAVGDDGAGVMIGFSGFDTAFHGDELRFVGNEVAGSGADMWVQADSMASSSEFKLLESTFEGHGASAIHVSNLINWKLNKVSFTEYGEQGSATLRIEDSAGDGGCFGYSNNEHPKPCSVGERCVTRNNSAWCEQCDPAQVSKFVPGTGHTCVSCAPGTQATADQGGCQQCVPGKFSALGVRCVDCPSGQYTDRNGTREECILCPEGYNSTPGSAECDLCARSYYATRPPSGKDVCKPCREILVNPTEDMNARFLSEPQPSDPDFCLGGARRPRSSNAAALGMSYANIVPFEDYWTTFNLDGEAQLLLCESRAACLGELPEGSEIDPDARAFCGHNTAGFKCSACKTAADPPNFVDYAMVQGSCVECEGFNFKQAIQLFIEMMLIAIYLLHKSVVPAISEVEVALVWDKVAPGEEEVAPRKIRDMLWLMGIIVRDERVQTKLLIKLIVELEEAKRGLTDAEEEQVQKECKEVISSHEEDVAIDILRERAKSLGAMPLQLLDTRLTVTQKVLVDEIVEFELTRNPYLNLEDLRVDLLKTVLQEGGELLLKKRSKQAKAGIKGTGPMLTPRTLQDLNSTAKQVEIEAKRKEDIYHPNTLVLDDQTLLADYNGEDNEEDKLLIKLVMKYEDPDHEKDEKALYTEISNLPIPALKERANRAMVACGIIKDRMAMELEAATPKTTVHKSDFVRVQMSKAETAVVEIMIFFLQTVGLLLSEQSRLADLAALDSQTSLPECLSTVSSPIQFGLKTVWKPATMAFGCLVFAPKLWMCLRGLKCLNPLWKISQAPPKLHKVHMHRSLVNVYLLLYAPVTREALSMLVCKNMCAENDPDPRCADVNIGDTSIRCWEGEHLLGVLFGLISVTVYCLVIPVLLVRVAGSARDRREKMLALDVNAAEIVFSELDENKDNVLDLREFTRLLKVLRFDLKPPKEIFAEVAGESESIEMRDFKRWYKKQLSGAMSYSCFDVLYCTVNTNASWWFVQMLWVKTVINVLYLFRHTVKWDQWMSLTMMASGCLQLIVRPYTNATDGHLALICTLCIVFVVHTVVAYPSFEDEPGAAWSFAFGGSVLPLLVLLHSACADRKKRHRAEEHRDHLMTALNRNMKYDHVIRNSKEWAMARAESDRSNVGVAAERMGHLNDGFVRQATAYFALNDKDRSGYLTREELRRWAEEAMPDEAWDESLWPEMCRSHGADPFLGFDVEGFAALLGEHRRVIEGRALLDAGGGGGDAANSAVAAVAPPRTRRDHRADTAPPPTSGAAAAPAAPTPALRDLPAASRPNLMPRRTLSHPPESPRESSLPSYVAP